TLTSFIDKLERKGVVKRKHSHKDRRVVLLHPTRKGQQLIEKYQHILFQALESFLDHIPHPQREAFFQAVSSLPATYRGIMEQGE
ncbi:MAG: MarR family transcriptional regulator, partial [Bacteroidota bacterium]